jgi:hypothetical protein
MIVCFVMSLLLASVVQGRAWSVHVENKCEKTPVNDAKINVTAYSHLLHKYENEGGATLGPGQSRTFQMSGAWCVAYVLFNDVKKMGCAKVPSGWDSVGIPCCWDVYYEAKGKGGSCALMLK